VVCLGFKENEKASALKALTALVALTIAVVNPAKPAGPGGFRGQPFKGRIGHSETLVDHVASCLPRLDRRLSKISGARPVIA
jgi:hypothetical protein